MKNNKLKEVFKYVKESRKDNKKKAIVFFAFYFVFFAILITLLRVNKANNPNPKQKILRI